MNVYVCIGGGFGYRNIISLPLVIGIEESYCMVLFVIYCKVLFY